MKYYLDINGVQLGPFEKNELISNGLTRDTYVWCELMAGWTIASQVDDLADILPPIVHQTQPVQQPQYYISQVPQLPETWMIQAILVTLFCCFPFGVVAIVKASQVTSRYRAGDYEGAESASKSAKLWVKYSLLPYAILFVLLIFLWFFSQW